MWDELVTLNQFPCLSSGRRTSLSAVYLYLVVIIAYSLSPTIFLLKDLARLFVWVIRNYEEIDPIILSGETLRAQYIV